MKTIRLLLLLLLVFVIGNAAGTAAEQKETAASKAEQPFKVKLPDGLYLFQPKLHESRFSPLFIVENDKLIDPYPLAKEIGIPKFMKKYVTGKTFNVYVGTEMIGRLRDVKLKFSNIDKYSDIRDPSFPDIYGKGVYNGNSLPGKEVDNSIYIHRNLLLPFATLKAVATPQSFQVSKKAEVLTITEEDKAKAIEAVRKYLITDSSEAMETTKRLLKRFPERHIIFGEGGGRLEFIKAVDVNGNGKKDLIGVYHFSIKYKGKSKPTGKAELFGNEILFILWDTGKIEKILVGGEGKDDARLLIFILGGLIDIEQDEVQELIVLNGVSRDSEVNDERIKVMRHSDAGWRSIYSSKKIYRRSNK